MGWLRSIVMGSVVLILATTAQAIEQDLKDCIQFSNLDDKIEGCSRVINQATGRDPILFRAYTNRALGYSSKGDLNRALADYDQAIKFNPRDVWTYVNRSGLHLKMGKIGPAQADHNRALSLNPTLAGSPQKSDHPAKQ